jgi:hypothetical protein
MSKDFTVQLPCKPYVKHFLTINFGSPAELASDHNLLISFRKKLRKSNTRFDSKIAELPNNYYSALADICISQDDFYRYGWELSKTDIIAFGKEVEAQAKFFMRNVVFFYESLMPQKNAILKFQERFGFTEDIWSYESIKKDYYRNQAGERFNLVAEISKTFEKKIMVRLSDLGTISPKMMLQYENCSHSA